jgi:hypothetical protein
MKLDSPVCQTGPSGFRLLFVLCVKGGNSGHNGSNLDKGNILEPTFDTLIEEGRNAFEAYRANHEEIFLSHYKVT